MSTLLHIFFMPFIWLVSVLFKLSFMISSNPGVAVVWLTAFLSLIITPVYWVIEKYKAKQALMYAEMNKEIAKITAVYTGRERFFYVREIQRRYKFNHWAALVPTLGLLIQIPFLLAAYKFLSSQAIFDGASYLYIRDLSKPDTVATLLGLPINLLPILMTIVNVISGYIYGRNGGKSERIQYMVVAAIFLALLYNVGSAVVLYWTLSNVFALIRMLIMDKCIGHGNVAIEPRESIDSRSLLKMWMLGIFLVCISFAAYMAASACMLLAAVSVSKWSVVLGMFNAAAVSIIIAEIIAIASVGIVTRFDMLRLPLGFRPGLMLQAVFISLFYLWKHTNCPVEESALLKWFCVRSEYAAILCAVIVTIASVQSVFEALRPQGDPNKRNDDVARHTNCFKVSLWALLYTSLVLMIWQPLLVYASEPGSFPFGPGRMVWGGIKYGIVFVMLFLISWRAIFAKRRGRGLAQFLAFAGLMVFVNLFVRGNECGTLQGAELVNTEAYATSLPKAILDFFVLLACATTTYLLFKFRKERLLIYAFVVLHIAVMVQTCGKLIKARGITDTLIGSVEDFEHIKFSKNHKNVLIVLLDMAQGASFKTVMDDKELAQKFTGFVYYPNSVSVSMMTCPSLPAMWAGDDFNPEKMNEMPGTNSDKAIRALRIMKSEIEDAGFDFNYYNSLPVYSCPETAVSPLYDRTFLSRISGKRDYYERGPSLVAVLRGNALYQAVPLPLKRIVYHDGKWIGVNYDDGFIPFSRDQMFCEVLSKLSCSEDTDRSVFNYIHVEVTHNPWGVPDENGKIRQVDGYEILSWTSGQLGALFDWMRANYVYDNTRIVLVSDHGWCNLGKSEFDPSRDPFVNKHRYKELAAGTSSPHFTGEHKIQIFNSLFVFKDYGRDSQIQCSNDMVGNVDMMRFALEDEPRTPIGETATRRAYLVKMPSDRSGFQSKDYMDVQAVYEITNNIFDVANWGRVK